MAENAEEVGNEEEAAREKFAKEEARKKEGGQGEPEAAAPKPDDKTEENTGNVEKKTSQQDDNKDDKEAPDPQAATFEGRGDGIDALNSSIKNAQDMYEKNMLGQQTVAHVVTAPVWGPVALGSMAAGALVSGAKAAPGALASGASMAGNALASGAKVAAGAAANAMSGMGNHPADSDTVGTSVEMQRFGAEQDNAVGAPKPGDDNANQNKGGPGR